MRSNDSVGVRSTWWMSMFRVLYTVDHPAVAVAAAVDVEIGDHQPHLHPEALSANRIGEIFSSSRLSTSGCSSNVSAFLGKPQHLAQFMEWLPCLRPEPSVAYVVEGRCVLISRAQRDQEATVVRRVEGSHSRLTKASFAGEEFAVGFVMPDDGAFPFPGSFFVGGPILQGDHLFDGKSRGCRTGKRKIRAPRSTCCPGTFRNRSMVLFILRSLLTFLTVCKYKLNLLSCQKNIRLRSSYEKEINDS